ncbi:MAG: hypothetical protein OEZ47_05305 [Gammaproteobacteria bacterium]|nr:hypothetical protein [Gammaproteobacteria bacterium]
MQWENLYYALTQFIHNFGAVAIVAGAFAALKLPAESLEIKHKLAWLVLIAWCAQAGSGLIFGGISLYFYGETPDLHATALVALIIKMICAASSIILSLLYVLKASSWTARGRHKVWHSLAGFGGIALTAAAFLRWFS